MVIFIFILLDSQGNGDLGGCLYDNLSNKYSEKVKYVAVFRVRGIMCGMNTSCMIFELLTVHIKWSVDSNRIKRYDILTDCVDHCNNNNNYYYRLSDGFVVLHIIYTHTYQRIKNTLSCIACFP